MNTSTQATQAVFKYHDRTKHHLGRYAAGPGSLDWADQPDPFRRFLGCEQVLLPFPGASLPVLFSELDRPELVPVQPLNRENLGLLLELAFGLSAWKQYGPERWALRCNPSSGNLHPTEVYLVNLNAELLLPGVYHYVSYDHALERRCQFSGKMSYSDIFIALTSIHWREAWKYGERSYRYCQHDIGHALGALCYAAAIMGWSVELMAECGDDELELLLGLDRSDDFIKLEGESPDLICRIRHLQGNSQVTAVTDLMQHAHTAIWYGKAERLSAFHRNHWPVIDEVAQATFKPHNEEVWRRVDNQMLPAIGCTKTAAGIIRQRRSAQRFDAQTYLSQFDFYRLLSAVMPSSRIPFNVWRWPPRIHLLLFVHRVENLESGLYLLLRAPESAELLHAAINEEFDWQSVDEEGYRDIPLYRLVAADCMYPAKMMSCHQDIAGDGAFSVSMLAEFQQTVSNAPWQYRRLFWETGLIGQALYLEAEAAGMRGTGIGCYFDDSVHEVLGLKDNRLQSLYHFTVGCPVGDVRLQTLPAYGHLQSRTA